MHTDNWLHSRFCDAIQNHKIIIIIVTYSLPLLTNTHIIQELYFCNNLLVEENKLISTFFRGVGGGGGFPGIDLTNP